MVIDQKLAMSYNFAEVILFASKKDITEIYYDEKTQDIQIKVRTINV